ncbi:MAG: TlpA family protein disulfide reductase, partial [Chitinophagaceae bacterium]
INKGVFLKDLSSGHYFPLRLKTNDSSYCYQLYKIPDSADSDIGNTVEAYGSRHYHYFQMEGKPLPDFNFVGLNGKVYNNVTCNNKVIVINTWFINCHACRVEMPALNQLVKMYKERQGIVFISLAWDNESRLKTFLKENIFKYAVVPDMQSYIMDTLGLDIFPTHIIINKTGKVAEITNNYMEMEHALKKIPLR